MAVCVGVAVWLWVAVCVWDGSVFGGGGSVGGDSVGGVTVYV